MRPGSSKSGRISPAGAATLATILLFARLGYPPVEGDLGDLSPAHLLDRRPRGLSGSERQRVALGRALSFGPRLLCLDEPLTALDDETREEMYALLSAVRASGRITALHVTHNREEARRLGTRVFRLEGGRIAEVARPGGPQGEA